MRKLTAPVAIHLSLFPTQAQALAAEVLKVEGTPTFFVNGDMIVEANFEEFDKRIKSLLKT